MDKSITSLFLMMSEIPTRDIAILPKTANKGHFFENQKKSRNTKNFNFLCFYHVLLLK